MLRQPDKGSASIYQHGSTSKTGQDTECLVDRQHHRRAEVSLHSMDTTWNNIRYKIREITWDKIRVRKSENFQDSKIFVAKTLNFLNSRQICVKSVFANFMHKRGPNRLHGVHL